MTRKEAAEKLTSLWYFLVNNDYPQKDLDALKVAIKALEQEPKQGHWIVVDDCGDNLICECSECKDEVWFKDASRMWNYCLSCGARMKGVEE